jgi:hypothetical protein
MTQDVLARFVDIRKLLGNLAIADAEGVRAADVSFYTDGIFPTIRPAHQPSVCCREGFFGREVRVR